MSDEPRLTHLDERGHAHMVDIAGKAVTHRRAVASGFVRMRPSTLAMITGGSAAKGDVLAVARIAGIMAAKRTSDLVPLCHPIALSAVSVEFEPCEEEPERTGVAIRASAQTDGATGVEMEALSAACVAALTIYDMLKAVDRAMVITDVRLESKEGGRSGTWTREEEA